MVVERLDWSMVAEAMSLLSEEIYYIDLVLLFDRFVYSSDQLVSPIF